MHTDGESHPGSLPPECAVCFQLHVQVEAAWVCTSCRRLHGHNQLDSGSVGRRGIPPIAYDDTSESDDGPAPSTSLADNDRTDFSRNVTTFCLFTSSERADKGSAAEVLDVEGAGQGRAAGGSDENIDPMDVDNNDERDSQDSVLSWVSGLTMVGMNQRPVYPQDIVWQVDQLGLAQNAPLDMLEADDEIELDDDMEMSE
ncbi:hypothetical protein ACLX1H_009930 [Fusarium chlamydosporum]